MPILKDPTKVGIKKKNGFFNLPVQVLGRGQIVAEDAIN